MKTYKTNYSVAVNWCNNALILCNNITEIDPSVYDNMRFELFDEEDGRRHTKRYLSVVYYRLHR